MVGDDIRTGLVGLRARTECEQSRSPGFTVLESSIRDQEDRYESMREAHCGDRRAVKLSGEGGISPQMGSPHGALFFRYVLSCRVTTSRTSLHLVAEMADTRPGHEQLHAKSSNSPAAALTQLRKRVAEASSRRREAQRTYEV